MLLALGLCAMLAGVVLGYKSLPRAGVGPASAHVRRAQAFAGAALMIVPWTALYVWLGATVPGWPEAYGSTCRKCLDQDFIVSPGLLSGGWRELGLFATLWFWPVVFALGILWAAATRTGVFARNAT